MGILAQKSNTCGMNPQYEYTPAEISNSRSKPTHSRCTHNIWGLTVAEKIQTFFFRTE